MKLDLVCCKPAATSDRSCPGLIAQHTPAGGGTRADCRRAVQKWRLDQLCLVRGSARVAGAAGAPISTPSVTALMTISRDREPARRAV